VLVLLVVVVVVLVVPERLDSQCKRVEVQALLNIHSFISIQP